MPLLGGATAAMEAAGVIRKGMMCRICEEFLRDAFNLPCGHNFCRECIDDALAEKNACPTCMNPAWQKDTLKAAITDSVVHEWVTNCEARYQAHTARLAKREVDGSETETDSAWDEASSQDDGHEDTADDDGGEEEEEEEEEREHEKEREQTEDQEQNGEAEEEDEEEEGNDNQPIVIPSGTAAQRADTHQASEGVVATRAAAASAGPVAASQALKEAANTHGTSDGDTAVATSSSNAKPPTRRITPSADGGREKENVAAQPLPCSASPSHPADVAAESTVTAAAAAATARDDDASAVAAPAAGAVGVGRNAGWSPSPRQNPPPRVRFESSPLRNCTPEGRPESDEILWDQGPREPSRKLPRTITGDAGGASPLSGDGIAMVAAGGGEPRSRPETPPPAQSVGCLAETLATGTLGVESERRSLPPPRDRDLEEDASTPQPLRAPPEREAAVEGGGGAMSSFAVGLPDTCDILDAEALPPRSPMGTTTEMLILTPPSFDGDRTTAAAAAAAAAKGGTVDPANEGEPLKDVTGRRASPVGDGVNGSEEQGGKPAGVGDESSVRASAAGTPGKYVHAAVPMLEESRDGARRPSSQGEVEGDSSPEGSGSEDDGSEPESVPLLCGDGIRRGRTGEKQQQPQQQHGPGQTTPPREVPSPCLQGPEAHGGIDRGDRAERMSTPLGEEISAEGTGDEEDGEETCDEAGSPVHPSETRAVTIDSCFNAGERPLVSVNSEREDPATGAEAAEPSKSDGLTRVLGAGGDTPEEGSAVPRRRDCERAVAPEKLAPTSREAKVPEPSATTAGVAGNDDPVGVAPEVSARSTPVAGVPKETEREPAAAGLAVESEKAEGSLRVPESCPAPGNSQGGRRKSGGLAGPRELEGGEPRGRALGGEDVRVASPIGAAAREAKVAIGPQASGQTPSPLQRGDDVDAPVCDRPVPGCREGQQREVSSRDARQGSPALEAGGSADRRPERSLAEVPETLPSQRASADLEGGGDNGSGPVRTVCLATQGSCGQDESARPADATESAREGDCESESEAAARQVPETAAAESLAIQRTPSLTTQEVPETAHAWGSAGACDGTAALAPGAGIPGDSTCSQSEVLETQLSQADAAQSTAESPVVRGGRVHGSEDERGRGAADAGRARNRAVQQQSHGGPLPSSSSSTLSMAAVSGGADSLLGGVNRRVGFEKCVERLGVAAAASPGSLVAASAGTHGAVDARGTPEDDSAPMEESPVSGSRKRSADSATPSPGTRPVGSESDGKQLRLTPPSVAALAAPCGRPSAATGDTEPASGKLPERNSSTGRVAEGDRLGTPTALRDNGGGGGGGAPGATGGESELLETGHDLAAMQDAWLAEGDYEFGGDTGFLDHVDETEEVRPPSPPPPPPRVEVRGSGGASSPRKKRSRAAVANPYAPQAHLDLHAGGGGGGDDDDDDFLPAGGAAGKSTSGDGGEGERRPRPESATAKARGARPALRRPSKGMMSFSAPAVGGVVVVAGGSQSLSDSVVAARLKEKKLHQRTNKILRAGHGRGSDGTAPPSASLDKSGSCSSWSTYDMGPDTQDVVELQALVAMKRARQNPPAATTTKPGHLDSIDLDDENDDESLGEGVRGGGRQGDVRELSSAEKKRKRTKDAVATTGKDKPDGHVADPRREVSSNNSRKNRRRRDSHRRRGHPVVVLLGCDPRELDRAKTLCERLGQRLETELVAEATHVVVGSRHTRARVDDGAGSAADGGGGVVGVDLNRRGATRRHELRTHGLQGYREAVMLGLWVLDFSWVDRCLRSNEDKARDEGAPGGHVDPSLHLPPPRDFELLGCSKKHEGCEPRRGRFKKGSGVPGVFDGMAFHVVAADARQPSGELEASPRLETERLLKLGGGVVLPLPKPKPKPSPPVRDGGGYVDDPFGAEDPPESRDKVVDVDLGDDATGGGSSGGGGNASAVAAAAAAAKGKEVVVLALPDCSEGSGGRVGPSLAEVAIQTRREIGAVAAVDRAWAVRSVENGCPVNFCDYDLGNEADDHRQVGSSGSGFRRPASKSRLSIRRGASPRSEFLLDTESERERYPPLPEDVCAERDRTARLLREADEVVRAPIRNPLPELGLPEDVFDFTRKGRKPSRKAKAPVEAAPVTYNLQNKAQRDLTAALDKAGYLDLGCSDPDSERRLSGFWFDFVYEGFYMRRSENAIPEAKRRGCPLDILRAEHDSHKDIQNARSRGILRTPPVEYPLWKAGSGEEDAVVLL